MSEPEATSAPLKPSIQEYESTLSRSASDVASFDDGDHSVLYRLRHFLHHNPAAVPLIVLVISLLVFGITLGGKFFSAFALTLILQQVAITGIVAAAQTLVILTAGIDLSVGAIMVLSSVVMGQFTFRYGLPAEISILFGFCDRCVVRLYQWLSDCICPTATVYRYSGHVAGDPRDQFPLFGE
jgi:fructose transport system permease protein